MRPNIGSPPREMTEAEYAIYQRNIARLPHTATDAEAAAAMLEIRKSELKREVEGKTAALLGAGVTIDGITFSLSLDRLVISEFAKNRANSLDYSGRGLPLIGRNGVLRCQNAAKVEAVNAAIDARYQQVMRGHADLLEDIDAAADPDTIIDSRQ